MSMKITLSCPVKQTAVDHQPEILALPMSPAPEVPDCSEQQELADACEALLQDAHTDIEELRRRQDLLRQGFNTVMQDMGQWIAFLRPFWTPDHVRSARDQMDDNEIEAKCLESTQPGIDALKALERRSGIGVTELAVGA